MGLAMATAPIQVHYAHIVKELDYCGSKAAIDNTRVRVNNVAFLFKEGRSPEQIREAYPDLSPAQVHGALTYYFDHTAEIDAELAEDQGWDEDHERRKAEYLARKNSR